MLIRVWQCRSFHTSSFQKVYFVPQNLVPDQGPSMVTKYQKLPQAELVPVNTSGGGCGLILSWLRLFQLPVSSAWVPAVHKTEARRLQRGEAAELQRFTDGHTQRALNIFTHLTLDDFFSFKQYSWYSRFWLRCTKSTQDQNVHFSVPDFKMHTFAMWFCPVEGSLSLWLAPILWNIAHRNEFKQL